MATKRRTVNAVGAPTSGRPTTPRGTPALFRMQVGRRPRRVTIEERVPGGPLRMLVYVDGQRMWKALREAMLEGAPVRDIRITRTNGTIDEEPTLEVERIASEIRRLLARGANPWGAADQTADGVGADGVGAVAAPQLASGQPQGFTLGWLCDEALGPNGRFFGRARHRREQHRNLKRYLPRIVETFGRELPIAQLTITHLERFWRSAAEAAPHAKWDGFRSTEMALELLIATANWAGERRACPPVPVSTRWRRLFKQDWCAIRNVNVDDRSRISSPRYTTAESGQLFAGIDAHRGDARIRRALSLGAEQRLGQVIGGCFRTHLDLDGNTLTIPGQGNKRGNTIVLSAKQRTRLEDDLRDGDLAELEAKYQRGAIRNYPLFPGWIDSRSKRTLNADELQPITRRYAITMFRAFEQACGVAPVEGRGWKGLRAWGADAIQEMSDELGFSRAVAVHAQGWLPDSRTSARFYQEKDRKEIMERAAQVVDAAREEAVTMTPASLRQVGRPEAQAVRPEERDLGDHAPDAELDGVPPNLQGECR